MKTRKITIIWILLIAGFLYGFLSGIANQNRAQSIPPSKITDEAIEWSPSILFLPSFILCHTRGVFGMKYAKIGYHFDSNADRLKYVVSSTFLGFLLGAGALFSTDIRKMCRNHRTNRETTGAPPDSAD